MATYGQMVFTTQGLALYQKTQTGVQLNFTRMQIGSGQLAQGQDPTALTALITPVSYFSINSVSSSGNTATVKGIFENTNIEESTYSCELGLFATDPDAGEILYAYANAGTDGDTIPPISDGPLSKEFRIPIALGNSTNITATIQADTYIPTSDKGAANGVATLNANGYVVQKANSSTTADSASSVAWSGVTSTPTTLGGYGITDAINSGTSNESVSIFDALLFSSDTRSTSISYTNGLPTTITVTDPSNGNAVVETISVTWTNGQPTSIAKTAGGHTSTTSITWANGAPTSVTKTFA